MPSIAVVGASSKREKYGNKCVRAFQRLGWTVYPVNPGETEIEGLSVFKSVVDVPRPFDCIALYLPPRRVVTVLDEIAQSGCKTVYFNPGTESKEGLEKARALGLDPIEACVIVTFGERP